MSETHPSGDYERTFNERGHLYNRATMLCADARRTERTLLLDLLRVAPGHDVCDVPAGGGYVAEGVVERVGDCVRVICVEPAARFADGIDPRFERVVGRLGALPLRNASVDRVASLAGLHHESDKEPFFHEAYRVLRPGGRIAVADVLEGTPPARFLNGPVDRLTTTGHNGKFLAPGELTRLLGVAGFANVTERYCAFTWDFRDRATLVEFCGSLFGLVNADGPVAIEAEIEGCLGSRQGPDGVVHLPWSLVYAAGDKPSA